MCHVILIINPYKCHVSNIFDNYFYSCVEGEIGSYLIVNDV